MRAARSFDNAAKGGCAVVRVCERETAHNSASHSTVPSYCAYSKPRYTAELQNHAKGETYLKARKGHITSVLRKGTPQKRNERNLHRGVIWGGRWEGGVINLVWFLGFGVFGAGNWASFGLCLV